MDSDIPPALARLIVENAREYGIFTLDSERRITSWNSGAEKLMGWKASDILGATADTIFTPEDRAAGAPEAECQLADRDGRAEDDRWHLRKDGSRFWATGLMMPFIEGPAGYVKILRDQTERKRSADEQATLLNELARVNALHAELLGLVSHELRSPLTTIIGTAEVLMRGGDVVTPVRQAQALQDIHREGERMESLIGNMLGLARIGASGPVELEPILLQRDLQRLVDDHRRRRPERTIKLDLPADLPPALAQPVYLAQVVRNLLENSEKYAYPHEPIEIAATREGAYVAVHVRDRGTNISDDTLARIFTPFFRGAADVARASGLGLGMAVCERLIHAQGGTIRAAPRPGGGLEITFTLQLT